MNTFLWVLVVAPAVALVVVLCALVIRDRPSDEVWGRKDE